MVEMSANQTALIPLTQGQYARVSLSRYADLMRFKWCARWSKKTRSFYAMRNERIEGKMRIVLMHRQVLGLSFRDGLQGDHVDHDTLNNTDANLRIASNAENQRNRGKTHGNTSEYKGVTMHGRKWRSRIMVDRQLFNLGTFETAAFAHNAYVRAALVLHGEFARAA